MDLESLRKRRTELKRNSYITLNNMQKLADESSRVAEVAHNAANYLDNLDIEFEKATGLQGNDIKFLFAAVGMQIFRVAVSNDITKIENAGNQNRNESKLHELQDKIMSDFKCDESIGERPYYATMKHIISRYNVPYDATAPLSEKAIECMLKYGKTWDLNISDLILTEKISLFKGANHRFSTLGHDPLLGLIFGTANIMTNTITCVKTPSFAGGIGIPVLTTNHVVYTAKYTDPRISVYCSTSVMLNQALQRIKDEPQAFLAALIKQIIHIGTDLYTPFGIQLPAANLVLSKDLVEKLTKQLSFGDVVKVGASAEIASLINIVISAVHMLMYDNSSPYSREVYNVRTRKIIMYSNLIASASNVIWVGANMMAGNEGAIRQLDFGGLIITLNRLTKDPEYIRKIKEEFVFGEFRKKIQGDELGLSKPLWN